MTFYQELQLSSTGSKQLIRSTTDPKEKRRHILIYNFKVYLVMAFCVAVVSMYSKLTGSSNSAAAKPQVANVWNNSNQPCQGVGSNSRGLILQNVNNNCAKIKLGVR